MGLLNWDHRVHSDFRKLRAQQRKLRQKMLEQRLRRSRSHYRVVTTGAGANVHTHRQHPHDASTEAALIHSEHKLNASSSSERDQRLVHRSAHAISGTGELRLGFDIKDYIWGSNCLRQEYDEGDISGMQQMYFMEPDVCELLVSAFGKRRIVVKKSVSQKSKRSSNASVKSSRTSLATESIGNGSVLDDDDDTGTHVDAESAV